MSVSSKRRGVFRQRHTRLGARYVKEGYGARRRFGYAQYGGQSAEYASLCRIVGADAYGSARRLAADPSGYFGKSLDHPQGRKDKETVWKIFLTKKSCILFRNMLQ